MLIRAISGLSTFLGEVELNYFSGDMFNLY
jgi:hypothetical protein